MTILSMRFNDHIHLDDRSPEGSRGFPQINGIHCDAETGKSHHDAARLEVYAGARHRLVLQNSVPRFSNDSHEDVCGYINAPAIVQGCPPRSLVVYQCLIVTAIHQSPRTIILTTLSILDIQRPWLRNKKSQRTDPSSSELCYSTTKPSMW